MKILWIADSVINLQFVDLNNRMITGFYTTKTLDVIGYMEYKLHATAMSLSLDKAKKSQE